MQYRCEPELGCDKVAKKPHRVCSDFDGCSFAGVRGEARGAAAAGHADRVELHLGVCSGMLRESDP